MRKLLAIGILSLCNPVQAQQPLTCDTPSCFSDGKTGRILPTASSTLNAAAMGVPDIRDAVIQMRDGRLFLIRRIERCSDAMTTLIVSADVAKAECFK